LDRFGGAGFEPENSGRWAPLLVSLALLLWLCVERGFESWETRGSKGEKTGQYFLQFYNNGNEQASDVNVKVKLAIFCVEV
jgi:hypothetical protein